jgi:hypothetical protein
VAHAVAPKTDVAFNAGTDLSADGAVAVGNVAALPPLVVELAGVILSHDVLAVRFTQFGEPANLVDDYSALLTLEDVGEPPVGESAAQVAEVEGLLLRPLPFVLRRTELVTHYLVLDARL